MATGYIMLDSPNPYTPQGGYPRRSGFTPTGTCIVHTSEGAWSAGVDSLTNLVRSRRDYGCYHRACDWQDVALYYPWEWECWQDSETNNWAVGIAAACRTEDWGNMPADVEDGFYRNMGRMAADFVTYMRDTYGVEVPRVRITGAQARAGVPGFCAHGDSGVSRTDPGTRFNWARFFDYTNQALGGLAAQGSITEEDGLSQAEVDQIKDHFNRVILGPYDWTDGNHPAGVRGDVLAAVSAVPGNVWGTTVSRDSGGGVGNVPALQELADAKTFAIRAEARTAAVLEALKQVATAPGAAIDMAAVERAAEAGAAAALSGLKATATVTLEQDGEVK